MLTDRIFAFAQIADQVVLWILVLLSIVSLGIILERYFRLRTITRSSEATRAKVKNILQTQSLEDVEALSKEIDTLEGRALNLALRQFKERGDLALSEFFDSFTLAEKPELEKYLGFLATVASNAPYIGLLGTVLGIMKAFNDLAMDTSGSQQTVMAGISLALVATAAGLFVAIPAVIAYNYFQRKVKMTLQNLSSVKELCLMYAKLKRS